MNLSGRRESKLFISLSLCFRATVVNLRQSLRVCRSSLSVHVFEQESWISGSHGESCRSLFLSLHMCFTAKDRGFEQSLREYVVPNPAYMF